MARNLWSRQSRHALEEINSEAIVKNGVRRLMRCAMSKWRECNWECRRRIYLNSIYKPRQIKLIKSMRPYRGNKLKAFLLEATYNHAEAMHSVPINEYEAAGAILHRGQYREIVIAWNIIEIKAHAYEKKAAPIVVDGANERRNNA